MPGASNREKADKKDQLKERMKAEKDQRQAVKQEYIASVEQRMRGEKKDKDGKSVRKQKKVVVPGMTAQQKKAIVDKAAVTVGREKKKEAAESVKSQKAQKDAQRKERDAEARAELQEKLEKAKDVKKQQAAAKRVNESRNVGKKWAATMVPSALVSKTSLRREEAQRRASRLKLTEEERNEFLIQEEAKFFEREKTDNLKAAQASGMASTFRALGISFGVFSILLTIYLVVFHTSVAYATDSVKCSRYSPDWWPHCECCCFDDNQCSVPRCLSDNNKTVLPRFCRTHNIGEYETPPPFDGETTRNGMSVSKQVRVVPEVPWGSIVTSIPFIIVVLVIPMLFIAWIRILAKGDLARIKGKEVKGESANDVLKKQVSWCEMIKTYKKKLFRGVYLCSKCKCVKKRTYKVANDDTPDEPAVKPKKEERKLSAGEMWILKQHKAKKRKASMEADPDYTPDKETKSKFTGDESTKTKVRAGGTNSKFKAASKKIIAANRLAESGGRSKGRSRGRGRGRGRGKGRGKINPDRFK